MTKPTRRFVGKALSDGTWRIWNKKARKYWGEPFDQRPDALIDELNGKKRPDKLIDLTRQIQRK